MEEFIIVSKVHTSQHCVLPNHLSLRADKHLNFPGICIWESDEAGDITCDIINTLEVFSPTSFDSTAPLTLDRRAPSCFSTNEVKNPGQTIAKGHQNYDMMLNLQLGIRYFVGKAALTDMREMKPKDFDLMEKFWTMLPAEGSKLTPRHQSVELQWKD